LFRDDCIYYNNNKKHFFGKPKGKAVCRKDSDKPIADAKAAKDKIKADKAAKDAAPKSTL